MFIEVRVRKADKDDHFEVEIQKDKQFVSLLLEKSEVRHLIGALDNQLI